MQGEGAKERTRSVLPHTVTKKATPRITPNKASTPPCHAGSGLALVRLSSPPARPPRRFPCPNPFIPKCCHPFHQKRASRLRPRQIWCARLFEPACCPCVSALLVCTAASIGVTARLVLVCARAARTGSAARALPSVSCMPVYVAARVRSAAHHPVVLRSSSASESSSRRNLARAEHVRGACFTLAPLALASCLRCLLLVLQRLGFGIVIPSPSLVQRTCDTLVSRRQRWRSPLARCAARARRSLHAAVIASRLRQGAALAPSPARPRVAHPPAHA